MHTQIIFIGADDTAASIKEKLTEAGNIIKHGGLVAFPTETVYGLGGDALNPESSNKIYAAKGRPSDNPLIIHIADVKYLDKIVREVPQNAAKLAAAFWPGPLTMIFNKADIVPYQTTGGLDTVAVRIPSHPLANQFIRYSGGYVAAPSANLSGKPSPTKAKYVIQDLYGRIDMIIDAKGVEIGLESTIVDVTMDIPMILRPGYITKEEISNIIGETDVDAAIYSANLNKPPKAPGMKYRHYAPKGELVLVEGTIENIANYINEQIYIHKRNGKRTGIIGTNSLISMCSADSMKAIGSKEQLSEAAKCLYT